MVFYELNGGWNRGKPLSKEHKENIRKASFGNKNGGSKETHWHWQGGRPNCKVCSKPFRSYHPKHGMCIQCLSKTPERRKLLSEISPYKGTPAWNKGGSNWWAKGEKNNHWKGGVTPIHEAIRKSPEYKEWRLAVFTRDGFKCVICGSGRSGDLQADHIKPFCLYIDLRFDINNGRTLCKACHIAHGWNYFKEVKHKKIDTTRKAP
jgi:5-methylcytosine-specific restriction endonuclease McrA